MRTVTHRLAPALLFALLAVAVHPGTALAQPGTVQSWSKLSSLNLGPLGLTLANADEFGDAVAYLGDLDGAGPSVAAMAVSAIGDDSGGNHFGAVYILFLNSAGAVISHTKISATQGGFSGTLESYDEFGSSLAWLGDIDGAGGSVGALAVGAIGDDDGGTDHGAVYVLKLNASGSVTSTQKITSVQCGVPADSTANSEEFGGALAGLGDLDGAGASVRAMAVGAIGDNDGGTDRGAVFIVYLNSSGARVSSAKISDTAGSFSAVLDNSDYFGEDVADLGDLDGAGGAARSLAVTAVDDDDGGTGSGAVYLVHLNTNGSVRSWSKISRLAGGFSGPVVSHDNFGTAVVGLGDLDGSGPSTTAIAVSAGADAGLGSSRGAVYVLFLNSSGSVLSYQEISSTAGGSIGAGLDDDDEFGSALTSLGDIDGAGGAARVLVAGVGYDDDGGTERGAAYLMSLAGEGSASNPPVVTAPATVSVAENALLTVNVTASDADGPAISSLTASGLPSGATFTAGAGNTTGTLSWTPSFTQSGTYTVTFAASNTLSGSASTQITVTNVDRAPVVTVPAIAMGSEETTFTLNVTAADPDGQAITSLTATDLPEGATFTPAAGNASGTLEWTPTFSQAGSYTVTFTASNALAGSSTSQITIGDHDRAPLVAAPAAAQAFEGVPLALQVHAQDPDGDGITSLTALDLPTGASFVPAPGDTTGTLTWTPDVGQAGSYTVQFTASNALSGGCGTQITVSVPSAGVGPDEPALLRPRLAPSPLRSHSTLSFRTVEPGPIEVEILDLSGRRIRQLMNVAEAPAGVQRVSIDARSERGELLPAGVYLYRIRSARRLWSGRLVVAR